MSQNSTIYHRFITVKIHILSGFHGNAHGRYENNTIVLPNMIVIKSVKETYDKKRCYSSKAGTMTTAQPDFL